VAEDHAVRAERSRSGPDAIAWTQLIEGPRGAITGELRVASLADPGRSTQIGASDEWIAPLAVDARRLVYVIGGKVDDELRVRDLVTGADRIVATGPVGDSSRPHAWLTTATVVGDRALWQEQDRPASKQPPHPDATIHAVDLRSGDRSRVATVPWECHWHMTAGTRYVAVICGLTSRIYDARTLQPFVLTSPAPGVGVQASDDGLIWFEKTPTGRNVVVYRPRT